MATTKITIRVPDEVLASLRDLHAMTYPVHRLHFQTWLIDLWRRELKTYRP